MSATSKYQNIPGDNPLPLDEDTDFGVAYNGDKDVTFSSLKLTDLQLGHCLTSALRGNHLWAHRKHLIGLTFIIFSIFLLSILVKDFL